MTDTSAFDSLESLVAFVFQQLQTPQLSIDRIVDYILSSPYSVALPESGVVPARTVTRRMVANCVSNSSRFVHSGPAQSQLWALRPNNPFFQCDASIAATIEQMLNKEGPMTVEQLVATAGLPDADAALFERVLSVDYGEFKDVGGGRFWFVNTPLPLRCDYDTTSQALTFAFSLFPDGATLEELRRVLCLSTVNGDPITRVVVANEIARQPHLFPKVRRGRYAIAGSSAALFSVPAPQIRARASSVTRGQRVSLIESDEEDTVQPFNPAAFFGASFSFSPE